MQLDELDRLLKEWRANVDAAQNNLYELQKKLTYKLLCGDPLKNMPPMKLKGQSATKVAEALVQIQTVDEYLPLLDKTIHLAQTKRDTEMPRFMQGNKIQEIAVLLTGDSIELPAVPVPLAERGLLSASTVARHASPRALLDSMVDAFSKGQAVIAQVEQVWHSSKSKLDAAWDDLKQLEVKVNALGSEAARNELATARDALQNWQNSWEADPLGVGQGLDCLEKLKQRLGGFEQDKKTSSSELEQARGTMARLKLLPNMDANRLSSLENSLTGIEGAFIKGDYPLVRSLLDAWRKAAVDLESRKTSQTSSAPPKYTPGPSQTSGHDPRVNVVTHPPLVREKSDLERLVEGDVPLPPAPPAKVDQPVNPDLEKLVQSGPSTPPPAETRKPSPGLTDLIENGPAKTTPAPAAKPADHGKPSTQLTDLIEGNGKTTPPAPPAQQKPATPPPAAKDPLADLINGSGHSSAPQQPAQTPAHPASSTTPAKTDKSLGDLIEGKATPPAPPSKPPQPPVSGQSGSLADLIEGGNKGASKQNPNNASTGKPGDKPAGASGPKGSLADLFK
ncbi:MAG TPA: hypothetical protein V6C81_28995 [Planktothrix sp.]|jgi:hypothetical protein